MNFRNPHLQGRTLIQAPVLVLNRHYLPVHITSVRRALSLLYRGAAKALDGRLEPLDFPAWCQLPPARGMPSIGLVSQRIRVPRVILLRSYDQQPYLKLRFSRQQVLKRDRFTCQYCGRKLSGQELNLDHVIPKRYGGKTTWDNVVCCCLQCNRKKGGRTPEEAGMTLIRPPRIPYTTPVVCALGKTEIHEEWRPFLGLSDHESSH